MIKTYLKTLGRMFKKHLTRFLSLIFMVLISVGFISGIGSSTDKINGSLNAYYRNNNVSDLIIKTSSPYGFTADEISAVTDLYKEGNVNTGLSLDVHIGEDIYRLYFLDFGNWTVNVPDIIEGSAPQNSLQVFAERADNKIKGLAVGSEIEIPLFGQNIKVEVSGTIQSPLTFALDGEPSYENGEDIAVPDTINAVNDLITLDNILYISKDVATLPVGDIYVSFDDKSRFNAFGASYKKQVEEHKQAVSAILGGDVSIITLYDNYSYKSLSAYAEKVEGIGYILMVAFLLVTALVVLSTMTRLVDEERSQVACLKTLGYSSADIISKYLLFALVATGIGGVGAYFAGLGLARLIYYVFNYSFAMPPISTHVAIVFYIITLAVIVVATLVATWLAGLKLTNERPANLLRPKPPRAGKKVFLERIPILWNRLSFKYKSTVRNVLRYKSRFIMTVVAVAFSTALVLTGIALLDLCLFGDFGSASIMGIAVVIVIFAGLLTAVVIYTLTNINISERNKEIATLMVLGYQDREVTGYIYREVYINTVIGIIFGYPLSTLLITMIFNVMGFGSLGGISWFMWLVAPVVVLLFTCLVTLTLRRKIVKINMNESLKANE